MGWVYLGALLGASGCLCLIDARWRLFFWRSPRRAALVTVLVTAFLLLWDAAGIGLGIFLRGRSPLMTGVELAPQLPLEEPVFLAFLTYTVAMALFGARRVLDARRPTRPLPERGEAESKDAPRRAQSAGRP